MEQERHSADIPRIDDTGHVEIVSFEEGRSNDISIQEGNRPLLSFERGYESDRNFEIFLIPFRNFVYALIRRYIVGARICNETG